MSLALVSWNLRSFTQRARAYSTQLLISAAPSVIQSLGFGTSVSPAELRWHSKSSLLSSALFSKHHVFLHSFVRKSVQESSVGCCIFWAAKTEAAACSLHHLSGGQHTPPVLCELHSLALGCWARLKYWLSSTKTLRILSQPSEKPTHLAGKTTSVQTRSCQLFINVHNSEHDALTKGISTLKITCLIKLSKRHVQKYPKHLHFPGIFCRKKVTTNL